jgi:hypothetical protein
MRGALTIDEQSFGPEHPKVAGDQNNLAPLLKAMNRLAEAEPLMRRMMEILLKFAVATDHQHPHLTDVVGNFAGLLKQMGRSPQEVLAELNAVGRPFGIRFCRIPQIRNRHLHGFNGVAPIYFVEVPGWDSKGFDQPCAAWVPVTTVELP